ncbi:hypothetical protein SY89_02677 [Halolamina pelagica]|uniref:Uncharacterized protein n=1 Tax=Halolamina pelagica TaxID=699431 RepID=A0A0P7GSL5_9EURY|nr:hypothetical protein SY89_02677 [Halolamina pelagica]
MLAGAAVGEWLRLALRTRVGTRERGLAGYCR